jgi:EAL domain-containing protein (putative c-di-GMP-specific phosphodiesterase class I)
MLAYITSRLAKASFKASMIKFEITETAAIGNLRNANSFIKALSEIGCQFSLDDFGSGLSSFGYLKNLPVQSIKIDGMFVKDMISDPLDFEMVKSINDIGHVMGLETIAEFVEDEQIWQKLRAIGVDYGQGYHLGKPVPIDTVLSPATVAKLEQTKRA